MVIALARTTIDAVRRQGRLHVLPEIVINDLGVLARVGLVLVHDLAEIDAVLQYQVEPTAR